MPVADNQDFPRRLLKRNFSNFLFVQDENQSTELYGMLCALLLVESGLKCIRNQHHKNAHKTEERFSRSAVSWIERKDSQNRAFGLIYALHLLQFMSERNWFDLILCGRPKHVNIEA